MKPHPRSIWPEMAGVLFEGDSSSKEPTLVSEVAAAERTGRALHGIDPEASIIASPSEDATIAPMAAVPVLVFFPDRRFRQDAFVSLQSWEGTVMRVLNESFAARLVDRSGKTHDEEAEFPLSEVSDDDRELIQEGAVFYWNIGYIIKPSGQKIRASIVRFRRLPAWTKSEIDSARQAAEKLADEIGWR
ncbi:MAG: hypothetical protein ABIN58_12550 [candidate division WOR-3 bacterium]